MIQASADLEIRAKILNNSSETKTITINGILRNPDNFTTIEDVPNPAFDVNAMCPGGKEIKKVNKTVTIEPGSSYQF